MIDRVDEAAQEFLEHQATLRDRHDRFGYLRQFGAQDEKNDKATQREVKANIAELLSRNFLIARGRAEYARKCDEKAQRRVTLGLDSSAADVWLYQKKAKEALLEKQAEERAKLQEALAKELANEEQNSKAANDDEDAEVMTSIEGNGKFWDAEKR